MTEEIRRIIFESEPFARLRGLAGSLARGGGADFSGAAGSLLACAAAMIAGERPVLLITPEEDRAEQLRDDCALLLGEGGVRFFGARPAHHAQALDLSAPIARIETLKALSGGGNLLIVAPAVAVSQKLPPPAMFRGAVVELRVKEEHPFEKLLSRLED